MKWENYEKRRRFWEIGFWVFLGLLNGLAETLTTIDDHARLEKPIEAWEPFTWAFSSQLVGLVLIPSVLFMDRVATLKYGNVKRGLLIHGLFSVVWSLMHVAGMVALRKAVYFKFGSVYDFGDWTQELVYEYRKDLLSYAWFLGIVYAYRAITKRLRGEAQPIDQGEDAEPSSTDRFLVKKIGKEFLVQVSEIEYVEAAGNYMNLHVAERVYPLRATMAQLEKQLDPQKFVRIHRSYLVNINQVHHLEPLDSGDAVMHLRSGKELPLSRRYKDQVKDILAN